MKAETESSQNRIIIILTIAALVIKASIAFLTYGTNDVTFFQTLLLKAESQDWTRLYHEGIQIWSPGGERYPVQPFVQTPFLLYVLRFWQFLAIQTHLTFQFWLRFSCALADTGSLMVVWRLRREVPKLGIRQSTLMLLAACPVSICISGFHGQIDPIMVFFLLTSVLLIETKRSLVLAGVFMGIALSIKAMPVILIPVILLYLPELKSRLKFAVVTGLTLIFVSLPYVAHDPWLILRSIAGYSSVPSFWMKLSGILGVSLSVDKLIFVVSIILLSIGMNRPKSRFPLFAQCGLIIGLALFATPGFGAQYLAWAVPWIVCLGVGATLTYYLAAGAFLFTTYTLWSHGIPWYRAESLGRFPLTPFLEWFLWCMLGMVFLMYVRAWRNQLLTPTEEVSERLRAEVPRTPVALISEMNARVPEIV